MTVQLRMPRVLAIVVAMAATVAATFIICSAATTSIDTHYARAALPIALERPAAGAPGIAQAATLPDDLVAFGYDFLETLARVQVSRPTGSGVVVGRAVGFWYDDRSNPTRASARPLGYRLAADSGDTLLSAGGGSARLPMNMGTVRSVASRYGVQIDDLSINIDKSRAGIRGSTAPNGCVTLCRGACESEEQLAKTLVHERVHVEDLRGGMPYPRTYDAASAAELRAEEIASAWWESFR